MASVTKVADAFPSSVRLDKAKQRVQVAAEAIEDMVNRHAGDRATLELILDNLGRDRSEKFELSRKLSFRGQSGLYGVQARTRICTWFVVPSRKDPAKLDVALIRGYTRLRRLRHNIQWPLFKTRLWGTDKEWQSADGWAPVDPDAPRGIPLLTRFCSGDLPTVEMEPSQLGNDYTLNSGPVGTLGAVDCFTGEIRLAAVNRYATPADRVGTFGTAVTTPSEHLVLDVIYHNSLPAVVDAKAIVFNELVTRGEPAPTEHDPRVLPIGPQVVTLAGSPPAVATPLVPRYAEMVAAVFERAGWSPGDFRGVRLEMQYPPLNSQFIIRYQLDGPAGH